MGWWGHLATYTWLEGSNWHLGGERDRQEDRKFSKLAGWVEESDPAAVSLELQSNPMVPILGSNAQRIFAKQVVQPPPKTF